MSNLYKNPVKPTLHAFSVAPMLDWTTPACRELHRLLLPEALLYTEMVTAGAIIYGDAQRHLAHCGDMPCVLQLGGGNPLELACACEIAQDYDYTEINLNVGCPSDRVQNNRIGACLMDDAALVARCLQAMQQASSVPVTVKHRLGIDEQDERQVIDFVDRILQESDCRTFIVHARKAWLQGLSPRENRDVPPLNYELVYELKQRFPESTIVINGGIETIAACEAHLAQVDGVMLGRAPYKNPALLLEAARLFGREPQSEDAVMPEIEIVLSAALARGARLSDYTRHLLGFFQGRKGAKRYRRILSEEARQPDADLSIWRKALVSVGIV